MNDLKLPALKVLAVEEKVVLPANKNRILKADYVEAILLFRHPTPTDEELALQPAQSIADNDVALQQQEALDKRIIGVDNVTKLTAIMAKEKIVFTKGGRKTKADYVNAIYLGRLQKKTSLISQK